MIKSERIDLLATALSKAQGEIKAASKDSKNPFFKSSYADLASIWDACREPLSKNGLAVIQMPEQTESSGIAIETLLTHSSGQWISNKFIMPVGKLDAQGVVSSITYARRTSLAAFVGVAPKDDSDDDGNKACRDDKQIKLISVPQMEQIAILLKETNTLVDDFLSSIGAKSLSEFPENRFEMAIKMLNIKKSKMGVLK